MNFPSLRLVQKKNRPEKFPFIATPNNLNVLADLRWSLKCFFALNSPIFQTSAAEEQEQDQQLQNVMLSKQM